MKHIVIGVTLLVGSFSLAVAQTAGGSTGAGAKGYSGSTLSSGQSLSGTGGSPGPNTSNALNHGTTGSNMEATSASQGAVSHGNAVDTPAANSAANNLGNTDTGVLKK